MGNRQSHQQGSFNPAAYLPRNFTTNSATPKKLVSSFIALVRPWNSPESPPWMVLSVETSKGVTQLFNPFTRTPIQNVDLTKFRVTKVATECHIVDDHHGYGLFCPGSSFYVKVLMFFPASAPPSVEYCHLFATFDDGQVRESYPFDRWHAYFQKAFDRSCYIDDIINYRGRIYALDKSEQLFLYCKQDGYCSYCNRICHFCEPVVRKRFDFECNFERNRPRKRLVVSSSGKILYMVEPIRGHGKLPSGAIELYFRVYELDYTNKRWCMVSSFMEGGVEQVLFVTRDYCFFVGAKSESLRNCIVFSDDAFPHYKSVNDGWDYTTKRGNEVAVFSLDKDDEYSLPIENYPNFPLIFWSTPPPWVLQNASSQSLSQSETEAQDDGMSQSDSDNKDGAQKISSQEQARFGLNGSEGWIKIRRCKCQPPKYCNIKISGSMNNLDRPYYECDVCGEFDWVGEAEFMRSNDAIVADVTQLKASFRALVKRIFFVVILMYCVSFIWVRIF